MYTFPIILSLLYTALRPGSGFAASPPVPRPISPSASQLLTTTSKPFESIHVGDTEYLRSIKIPNFGVAKVWGNGGRSPTWLHPIDTATAVLLLNLVISDYATRPSDGTAHYGSIGPESSAPLAGVETRAVIKQWVYSNISRFDAAPMLNKDIAYGAQMIRYLYEKGFERTENGWKTCNLMPDETKGRTYVANCSAVIVLQRDLWVPGE
ncbi:MAG: hypothetical protein Q9219_003764 [cf. Caloplaca sp. 3 TL-2023]